MKFSKWKRGKLNAAALEGEGILINDTSDFLDIVANAGEKTILVKKEHFHPDFFELRTGMAGEILQKTSNYGIRLGIIGDHSSYTSKALNDFIRESNKTGQVVFARDVEDSARLFTEEQT